jgi:hypothetical protein
MIELRPCTLWHRFDPQQNEWEFNHLSDGHEQGERPAPKCKEHVNGWGKGRWSKQHAWLTAENKVVHYGPEDLEDELPQS